MSRRKRSQFSNAPPTPAGRPNPKDARIRIAGLVVAIVLTVATFFNSISGEFVYDDDVSISVRVTTFGKWSDQGERDARWSNYWRPAFALWMMGNHKLFGREPAGWHVSNILLHCCVLLVAGRVLRRLGVGPVPAGVILCIFAIHPVQTESVAWVSGCPNLLLALFALGAFELHLLGRASGRLWTWLSAFGLFVCALLSKETAFLFPVLIAVTEWALTAESDKSARWRLKRSLVMAAPYLGLAILLLIVRTAILGVGMAQSRWAASGVEALMSMPQVLVFYLRQVLFPVTLSPQYPVEAIRPSSLGLANFAIPLTLVLVAAAAAYLLWRRGPLYKIAIALFFFPLVPALNISAFSPGQLVHDRYLYLPLFGLLIVFVQAITDVGGAGKAPANGGRSRVPLLSAAAVVIGLLMIQTVRYNRVWLDDIALWERGVAINPASTRALTLLGEHYQQAGRIDEAKLQYRRALEIHPGVSRALVRLGILACTEQRYEEAERLLRRVHEKFPNHQAALENLALVYWRQGRLDDAIAVFEAGREHLPHNRTIYTINIARAYREVGKLDVAIETLESISENLAESSDVRIIQGWLDLAEMYQVGGNTRLARMAYERFLDATESMHDRDVGRDRQKALEGLGRLKTAESEPER